MHSDDFKKFIEKVENIGIPEKLDNISSKLSKLITPLGITINKAYAVNKALGDELLIMMMTALIEGSKNTTDEIFIILDKIKNNVIDIEKFINTDEKI